MLFSETLPFYCENNKKGMNKLYEQNEDFLNSVMEGDILVTPLIFGFSSLASLSVCLSVHQSVRTTSPLQTLSLKFNTHLN